MIQSLRLLTSEKYPQKQVLACSDAADISPDISPPEAVIIAWSLELGRGRLEVEEGKVTSDRREC